MAFSGRDTLPGKESRGLQARGVGKAPQYSRKENLEDGEESSTSV